MRRLMLYDRLGNPLGELSENDVFEAVLREEINGEHSLTITTTQVLEKGIRLLYKDGRGKWREFAVAGIDAEHASGNRAIGTYYCVWSVQEDLQGVTVSVMPGVQSPVQAGTALTSLLSSQSRWAKGTVTNTATGGASMYDRSAWEALSVLVEVWGGEVDATITIGTQTGVTGRLVDLYTKQGNQTALRRFDFAHDLQSVKRTLPDTPFYCRISPRGAGEETDAGGHGRKITIESVNSGKDYLEYSPMVDVAKLTNGSGYIYPTLIVENSNCKTPTELKTWAQSVLAEYCVPKVTYEIDVLQAGIEGVDFTGVSLGDAVQVVDRKFSPAGVRIEGRVRSITTDLLNERDISIVIGDAVEDISSKFASVDKSISIIGNDITVMSTAEYINDLLDRINTEINATGGYTYITEGQGIRTYDTAVSDPLVGAEASAVVEIKGGTIRIANSKTAQGAWNWRSVFTSGHITADLVTAANLTAGYIGSASGGNYWNLDTGEFRLAEVSGLDISATNLVRNGDFSNSTTYWSGTGTTRTVETDSTFGHVLKAVQTSAGGGDCRVYASSSSFTHKANTSYAISFWAKANGSNTIYANRGASETEANSYVKGESIGTTWKRFTGISSSANAYSLSFYLGNAGTLYIANVMLVEGITPMLEWSPDPRDAIVPVDQWLTQTETFNKLTNNGALQGLYMSGGELYINASYLKSGQIAANLITAANITAGTIGNATNTSYWDIDNGNMVIRGGNMQTKIGSTGTVDASVMWKRYAVTSAYTTADTYGLEVKRPTTNGGWIGIFPSMNDDLESGGYHWGSIVGSGRLLLAAHGNTTTSNYGYLKLTNAAAYMGSGKPSSAFDNGFQVTSTAATIKHTSIVLNGATSVSGANTLTSAKITVTASTASGSNLTANGYVYLGSSGTESTQYVTIRSNAACNKNLTVKGSLSVTGTKNRRVTTGNYNERLLYAYETASPMFGDLGSGVIGEDGLCIVEIDDIFSELARADLGYQVFLQACGQGDLWVDSKSPNYFIVSGTPGLRFDWELKAKQTGFEVLRMEQPDLDPANIQGEGGEMESLYAEELEWIAELERTLYDED